MVMGRQVGWFSSRWRRWWLFWHHRSGIEVGESGVGELVFDGNDRGDGSWEGSGGWVRAAAAAELRERLGERACEGERPWMWRLWKGMVWLNVMLHIPVEQNSRVLSWSPSAWIQMLSSHDLSPNASPITWNCEYNYVSLYPCKSSLQSSDSQIQYKNFKFENSGFRIEGW